MNKGDALQLTLDYTVDGEAISEGEYDEIEFTLGSLTFTLSNGDITWSDDDSAYVIFLSQEDTFKLRLTNCYQIRLMKGDEVISSAVKRLKVGSVLSSNVLGDSITTSKYNALIDGSITSINSDVTSIRNYAFASCTNLTSAVFPNATTVGQFAFDGTTALTSAEFDEATSLGVYCFRDSTVQTLTAPALTTIGDECFYNSGLTEISSDTVTTVGASAFQACSDLTEAHFPNLTSIGATAFYNGTSLEVADIGSVSSLYSGVFQYCTSLKTLILRSSSRVSWSTSAYPFNGSSLYNGDEVDVYVPSDLVSSYESALQWAFEGVTFHAIEGSDYE